jgi:MYXO-CTERM domain-containing protein
MARGLRHTCLGLIIFGSACIAPMGEDEPELGSTEFAIVGGAANNGDPAVGILQYQSSTCSMTMVYDRFGLTARHCVQRQSKDPATRRIVWGELHDPSQMAVSFAQAPTETSQWHRIVDYRYHTSADIAVLELDSAPGAVMPMNTQELGAFVGRPVRIAGYGKTVSNPTQASERSGVKRQGFSIMFRTAALNDLGPVLITGLLDGQVGAKLCQGDSGGPSFMEVNGVEVLVGVNSVVGRDANSAAGGQIVCEAQETFNAHVRVDTQMVWINEAISDMDGGSTRLIGGCSAPGGDAGGALVAFAMAALGLLRRRRKTTTSN